MSQKIKSKDLSYDASLPPFLQRLRAQNAGRGDVDRHEHQIARPKKAKEYVEDDEPTIVDESGDLVTQEEFKTRTIAETKPEEATVTVAPNRAIATTGPPTKKRKVAKILGEADSVAEDDAVELKKQSKAVKKKSKAIKLAFEEDDGS